MIRLIIENEGRPGEIISAYFERYHPNQEPDILSNLKVKHPDVVWHAAETADCIYIESTLTDIEQAVSFIGLFAEVSNKKIYIAYTRKDFHIAIYEIIKTAGIEEKAERAFTQNDVYQIAYEAKRNTNEDGRYFKAPPLYYFDTIKYYWNEDHDTAFPVRPICFYQNNLRPVYIRRPHWTRTNEHITKTGKNKFKTEP